MNLRCNRKWFVRMAFLAFLFLFSLSLVGIKPVVAPACNPQCSPSAIASIDTGAFEFYGGIGIIGRDGWTTVHSYLTKPINVSDFDLAPYGENDELGVDRFPLPPAGPPVQLVPRCGFRGRLFENATTGSVVVTIWYKPDGDRAVPFTQTVKIVRVPPVGGFSIVIPVDKSALLSPYIGLYSTILVAAVATAVCVKRAKDGKEKR